MNKTFKKFLDKKSLFFSIIILLFLLIMYSISNLEPDYFTLYHDFTPTWVSSNEFIFYRMLKKKPYNKMYLYDINKKKYYFLTNIKEYDEETNYYPKFIRYDNNLYYLNYNEIIDIKLKTIKNNNFNLNLYNSYKYQYAGNYLINDNSIIKDQYLQYKLEFHNLMDKTTKEIIIRNIPLVNENPELNERIDHDIKFHSKKKNEILKGYIDYSVEYSSGKKIFVITITNQLKNQTEIYLYDFESNRVISSYKINQITRMAYYIPGEDLIIAVTDYKIFTITKSSSESNIIKTDDDYEIQNRAVFGEKGYLVYRSGINRKIKRKELNSWELFIPRRFEVRRYDSLSKVIKLDIPNHIKGPISYYDINENLNRIIFSDYSTGFIYLFDVNTGKVSRLTGSGATFMDEKKSEFFYKDRFRY